MPGKLIYGTRSFECPECEVLAWGNFKFCLNCKQQLIIECLYCNTQWRIGQEFYLCPCCGTPSFADPRELCKKILIDVGTGKDIGF